MEERETSFFDELNIREDATTAEVKQAYRRLSAVFHPDKQQDESLKEEAAESFTKIKDAYEVGRLKCKHVSHLPYSVEHTLNFMINCAECLCMVSTTRCRV